MKICIHRGTQQIGGIATEISTDATRILIDMGDELSLDSDFLSAPLDIPGVTDANGSCEAVLFTHYHGDHTGQMTRIRDDIPLYIGLLAKDIMQLSAEHAYEPNPKLISRISTINTFSGGDVLQLGDIRITPYSIDHSACDSYLFLIEADNKRVLYTGDFRMHGVRSKAIPKILGVIGKVDAVITEGTTIMRANSTFPTEWDLQRRVKEYLDKYKYVFLLCATTNLDRVFTCARAVPYGKYCICDKYQKELVETVSKHWRDHSSFYKVPKLTVYGDKLIQGFQNRGGLMFVRANRHCEKIIRQFDPAQSIMLYSMWDGYRTKPGSTIPDFLSLTGTWETLHTSGHAMAADIQSVVEIVNPELVIPMHTESPQQMQVLFPNRKVLLLNDKEVFSL